MGDEVDGDAIFVDVDIGIVLAASDEGFHNLMTGGIRGVGNATVCMSTFEGEGEVFEAVVVAVVPEGEIGSDVDEILD